MSPVPLPPRPPSTGCCTTATSLNILGECYRLREKRQADRVLQVDPRCAGEPWECGPSVTNPTPRHTSRLMKNASLGNRKRAGVDIEAPLDADSE